MDRLYGVGWMYSPPLPRLISYLYMIYKCVWLWIWGNWKETHPTSSLVESESEEGHDGHDYNVFDGDITTANDAATNQRTVASVVTENNDNEDGHTFDSIVSWGIGNMSLQYTQTNEGEGISRDDDIDILQRMETSIKQ